MSRTHTPGSPVQVPVMIANGVAGYCFTYFAIKIQRVPGSPAVSPLLNHSLFFLSSTWIFFYPLIVLLLSPSPSLYLYLNPSLFFPFYHRTHSSPFLSVCVCQRPISEHCPIFPPLLRLPPSLPPSSLYYGRYSTTPHLQEQPYRSSYLTLELETQVPDSSHQTQWPEQSSPRPPWSLRLTSSTRSVRPTPRPLNLTRIVALTPCPRPPGEDAL